MGSRPFSFIAFHRIAGNAFFAAMLIYSIVYAMERTTYSDSAWIFFRQVNEGGFACTWERFPAFIPEIPLFLGTKLGLSIDALLYVFSTGYILLFYFVWRICTYTLKNPVAGLTVIFGMILGVRELFIHTITETHQCIAYSALLYAVLHHDFSGRVMLKNTAACLTIVLVLFSHPMGVFTSAFVLGYYFTEKKNAKEQVIWLMALLILAVSLMNFFNPPEIYGEAVYGQMVPAAGMSSFFDSKALNFLLMHFPHFYWLPELAGLIVIGWLAYRREWLKLTLTVAGVLIYLVIACITFRSGDSSIMLERVFLPAFFMINLAFAGLLAQEKQFRKWVPMLLVVFFMVNGIRYINAGCLMYKKRVAYLDEIVKKGIAQGHDKYVLSEANTDMEKILVPWALGTETLIYSKIKYDTCISISLRDEACEPESVRTTRDFCVPVNQLDKTYFSLSANAYAGLQ